MQPNVRITQRPDASKYASMPIERAKPHRDNIPDHFLDDGEKPPITAIEFFTRKTRVSTEVIFIGTIESTDHTPLPPLAECKEIFNKHRGYVGTKHQPDPIITGEKLAEQRTQQTVKTGQNKLCKVLFIAADKPSLPQKAYTAQTQTTARIDALLTPYQKNGFEIKRIIQRYKGCKGDFIFHYHRSTSGGASANPHVSVVHGILQDVEDAGSCYNFKFC